METKKVLGIIFSLLFLGAFTFVLTWGIINFNKVKDSMSGTQIYDSEDLNNAYQDGYDTALKDKEEYTGLINSYRDTITTLNDNISQLNSQIATLQNNNKDYETQINNLTTQKVDLQTQVENLTTIKTNNENTIASLNSQITSLQTQVTNLTNSDEDKSEQITILNNQISTLQNTVSQLQTTNDMNVDTITSLNTQIANLNSQINDMTDVYQNYTSNINSLNNKINDLQTSINYYESYIANLESGEQVVATFEYDGSVYNIQVVNKGSKLSVTTPTDTDRLKFNYWTVDGEQVDLSTYTISTNTKFVANTTKYYCIQALNTSGDVVKTSYEAENSHIVFKSISGSWGYSKDGYEFDGWSNGENVYNLDDYIDITQDMILTPTFTKLHTVTFMYEEETKSTQTIRNGNYATNVTVDSTDYKVFNGWKLNGVITDISSYKITADTQFIADITYKYDVKFMVDDKEHNSQIVTTNCYPTLPTNPTKDGYEFDGWSNGENIVNPETIAITGETSYWASFTQLHTVTFTYEGKTISTQTIRNGNYATNVAVDNTTYKVFNGWKVNDEIVDLYSYKITADTQFVANITYYEYQFQAITFNGLSEIRGSYVWTDGTNIYYSYSTNHYVLDKSTNTWTTKTWNGLSSFGGYRVWTDGTNIYWAGSDTWYVLNKSTSTWTKTTWEGAAFNSILVSAKYNTDNSIWTDGENIYFSCYGTQYVLDKSTNTWNKKTWTGLTEFYGSGVWTDGENIYYSWGSSTHYKLNKDTSTWEKMTWKGFTSFHGPSVWTDGNNIYYSKGTTHYVLNKETNTWTQKTWDNLTEIEGMYIWTDGTNTYYSKDGNNYILSLVEKQ